MRTDLPATWFRLYAEFATDPKVQMLSETDQRRFLMVMCLRCCNGTVTLLDSEIAFQLRISDEDWQTTKNVLYKKGLIDSEAKPCKWESRQFDSDTSNARVAKHRALQKEKQPKKRNTDVTLPKQKSNAPETETETEKSNTAPTGFGLFYQAYPKKVARPDAEKAFKTQKINGELPVILADIENRLSSGEWVPSKEKRQFIPNPASYLNKRRWEDEAMFEKSSGVIAGAI